MRKIRELIRLVVIYVRYLMLTKLYKMDISKEARISFGAKLDKTHPEGIHIDKGSYIASGAIIFSHDFSRNIHTDTFIGERCFIGANAIIMPGVRIGDEVIIGAGSIVTKDIPSNTIAVGNPARILKEGIQTEKYGKIVNR